MSKEAGVSAYTKTELDALLAAHVAAAAAHHSKYTNAEADARAAALISTHAAIAAAHHAKYTDAEADARAAALIATHAADHDAHDTDEETWCYKLLCAITDPALINYVYALASFTCTEKSYFISCDDADIGTFAKCYLNMPTFAYSPFGMLPQLLTLDTGEVISFANNTAYGAAYVKASDVAAITDAKETWYKRLKYLQETIPTRYKVNHTAANQLLKTAVTVTNKAILGKVSLRAIGGVLLYLYDGSNYFIIDNVFGGVYSGSGGTTDYVYAITTPFFPLLSPSGCSFYMGSGSGANYTAGANNCYFEVYDNLPSPPW